MEVASIYINRILLEVIKKKASNLLLSIGSFPMLRIDGDLSVMENEGIIDRKLLTGIISILVSNEEWEEIEKKKEMVIVRSLSGGIRFRINIFFQKDLPTLSFYIIPDRADSINSLDLPPTFVDFTKLESGLVVVAGSSFCGKSSTVASFLEQININQQKYSVTLEDPIERVFINQKSVINQRQVGSDVSSFKDGLKYFLEEDIDVVYINDPRENFGEIMSLVFDLAAGNSLVVLEMNASSSVSVLEKILSSSSSLLSDTAARYYLSHVLKGVLVQNLLPKNGGGMVLACELLTLTPPIKTLIREGKIEQIDNVIESSSFDGMMTMNKSITTLKKQGLID